MAVSQFDVLNRAPVEQATDWLAACNASRRWIEQVLAARPYRDAAALLSVADRAARALDWDEVRQALNAHPSIGERAEGQGTEAQWSRNEQAALAGSDDSVRRALRDGNADYQQRFGYVFFIRAAGRSAEEMLAELRRRLGNDEHSERTEVTGELAQITRLRLERLLAR
jgi:2-oxo-4-hydroxy-4-carboxy-5-ureidoimidazoline decarboxylase